MIDCYFYAQVTIAQAHSSELRVLCLITLPHFSTKGLQKCSQVEAMMPDVCMEFFKEGPIYPFKEKACKNWIENNQETLNEIETKCNLGEFIYY